MEECVLKIGKKVQYLANRVMGKLGSSSCNAG